MYNNTSSSHMEKGAPLLSVHDPSSTQSNKVVDSQGSQGFRDTPFLLLFMGNCAGIFYLAFSKGMAQFQSDTTSNTTSTDDYDSDDTEPDATAYKRLSICVGLLICVTVMLSSGFLGFLIRHAASSIRVCLKFNIWVYSFFALVFAIKRSIVGVLICLFFSLLSACYYRRVKSRIPFASSNLKVACSAIRSHFSLFFVVWFTSFCGVAWVFISCLANIGLFTEVNNGEQKEQDRNALLSFLMLISFYWGSQVARNIGHVTTAGVVASWWFEPARQNIVGSALCRSCTTSLGSIAFGSLIVAFIQALQQVVDRCRSNNNGNPFIACIASCLLACLRDMAEYFNRWSFVYVGIYGTSFINSGKNVMSLFKNRGWTAIINDNLIQNVLSIGSVFVGMIVGCVGALIPVASGDWISGLSLFSDLPDDAPSWILFAIGFFIGLVINLLMVSVVDSGVATTFVCFAEAPGVFESTHPVLFNDLASAWRIAHGDCF